MPDQNKVAFNLPQNKSDDEKQQARKNIDAVALGVQMGDDPFAAVHSMLVHIPTASASGTVSFDGGATTPLSMVKTPVQSDANKILQAHYANGQAFFTWDSVDFDSGKFVVYDIANGTTSVANLYTNISNTISAGKIPLVKYEETTNPSQYGYYWPMSQVTSGTNFVRVNGDAVNVLTVLTTDQITINTYLYDTDKIETITVLHGATTWQDGPAMLTRLVAIGKTPLVKYDETGSGDWGYYWLASVTATDYFFARISTAGVSIISIANTTGSLTYGEYSFDSGKVETLSISNAATTLQNASTVFSNLSAAGKIPLVRYDETGSSDWGYYWLAHVTSTDYVFVRMTSTLVLTIAITISSGAITYQSYPVGMDLSIVGPYFSEHADYLRGDLVIYDDALKRFSNNHSAGSWVAADAITDNIVHNLGRVKNGGEIIDTGLHDTHWSVQNNALTKIDTQMNASGVTFEIDVDLDLGEVPNFVVQLKSRFGGTWNIVARYHIPGTSAVSETVTCWYSLDAGNVIPENVPVQITCVGNCWTWAVYVDPTAVQLSSVLESPEVPDVVGDPEEET